MKLIDYIFSLSVRIKLAVLIFFVVLSISSVSILINIDLHKNNVNILINELIRTNINSNKVFVGQYVFTRNNWELYKFLKTISASEVIESAGFIDNNNQILAHTDTKRYRINDEVKDFSNLVIVPFEQDGVEFGSFILDVKQQSFLELAKESFFIQMILFFLVAVLSFLISNIFIEKLLRRLDLLSNNAHAITEKRWDDVKYYHGMENDEITDLIKTTTNLMQDLRASIEKEEKNARITYSLGVLGEISSSFAHEIKNILQPLKLLIPKESVPDKEDMPMIHNALMRIDHQVADFLALARPTEIKREEALHVKPFVEESLELLQARFKEKSLHVDSFLEENFLVKLSPKAIELISMNLLSNAIDAAFENSTIEITWKKFDKNLSLLCIKNSGETMSTKTKENLFKPFYTTKKDGSGLGLFSIYKIVYLSGGYIEWKSENSATQFCLYIPTEAKKEIKN